MDKKGPKAFPNRTWETQNEIIVQYGMDLRDYFAAKVLQSILTGSAWSLSDTEATKKAYYYADLMLEARNG